jgi:hypothetical protein
MNKNFKGLWIPEEIIKDENLTWMEKLFIAEIDNLDNSHGCYASNNYFAKIFQLTPGRCSQIITSLKKKGYVSISFKKKGKIIEKRVLRILNRGIKNTKGGIKYSKEGIKNIKGGYLENAEEILNINTLNKNIEYNNKCDSKESHQQKIDLQIPESESVKQYLYDDKNWKYLESLFREKQEYDNWGKQRKHCKELDKRIQITYRARAPDMTLKEFTQKCVEFFWWLKKKSGIEIWKKQAFFPSTLNSERIWTMFLEEIQKRKKPTEEDYLRGIE